MKKLFWLVLIVLLPAVVAAQTPTPATAVDDVRRDARMHVGPFYVTPTILLKEFGLDSNVFNAAGDQKSDLTATVAPTATVWVPMARRALVRTTVGTDLVWYAKYASERSIDPQVGVRGEVYLHRLTFFAEDSYLNTRQRPNYEIDLRSRHLENDTAAGVDVRVTPKLSIEMAGLRAITRYDADSFFNGTSLQRTLNRTTQGYRVTFRDRFTPLTTVALRYEDAEDLFAYLPIRNSTSYRVEPGIEFKPKALINGSAYVGYRHFTPKAPETMPAFSGLTADLGLSYTLLGATTFGVSYRRDLTYSYEELQPFFVDQSYGVSVRRALGRRFDVLVSGDRHRYDYADMLVGIPLATDSRIDTTVNYAGSLGYRIGETGRIGFGVSYWHRNSTTVTFRTYDNLRIGSTMTYGF